MVSQISFQLWIAVRSHGVFQMLPKSVSYPILAPRNMDYSRSCTEKEVRSHPCGLNLGEAQCRGMNKPQSPAGSGGGEMGKRLPLQFCWPYWFTESIIVSQPSLPQRFVSVNWGPYLPSCSPWRKRNELLLCSPCIDYVSNVTQSTCKECVLMLVIKCKA